MPSRFRLVQDHPIAALLVAVVLALAGLAFGLYPRAESGIDGVQLTLQEGAFGPVVGFTDEGTARDYEQLIRGIVRSPGKGAPPEDLIEFFVAFMQPCAVRLAPGMRVRPVDRTVVERGLWCEVLDGEHAGRRLLIPLMAIEPGELRGLLWVPPALIPETSVPVVPTAYRWPTAVAAECEGLQERLEEQLSDPPPPPGPPPVRKAPR